MPGPAGWRWPRGLPASIQLGAGAVSVQLLAVERAVAGVDRDLGLADLGQDGRAGLLAQAALAARLVRTNSRVAGAGFLISLTATRGLGLGDALAVLLAPGR